jgi:hypothetical protein
MRPDSEERKDIGALLKDDAAVTAAMRKSVREDLLRHKAEGLPIVVCENGKLVWIPPDQIEERLKQSS